MARSLSIAALLAVSVVFMGVAEASVNITVGCDATKEKDVCSTCRAEQVMTYVDDGECHKYGSDGGSSYRVREGVELYGSADCTGDYTVVKGAESCLGNYTTAQITGVEADNSSFNATFCFPDAAKTECENIPGLLWTRCFALPLKATEECSLLHDSKQVAYTATVTNGTLVDVSLYLNKAECEKKHLPAFVGTALKANQCVYYQARYHYITGQSGPEDSGAAAHTIALLVAALAALVALSL